MTTLARDAGVELLPDPGRVVARLFLPGESTPGANSRTEVVLDRVLAAPPEETARMAGEVIETFGGRHRGLRELLLQNAALVRRPDARDLDEELAVVVGAVFTSESAIEGAALCNPSVVPHPDQSGLAAGALRVVVSLRAIGESHLSSIEFCEAIIGPGAAWEFVPREAPLELPTITDGRWTKEHFVRALEHHGRIDDVTRTVTQGLAPVFTTSAVDAAANALPAVLMQHPDARAQLAALRVIAWSAYRATFDEATTLSRRVLMPVAEEERRGVEDARFVRFVPDDGMPPEYRATYTAYEGQAIASRLLVTRDFRTFDVHRLTGPPTQAKGMALFPRPVGGMQLALSRGDGESISLTRSENGLDWEPERHVYRPEQLWESVQSGNCGSPIETPEGWLVLTHGVGPMRTYRIGAILLALEDPSRVVATLTAPLLQPDGALAAGYVPNVVYTCGAILHDGTVWIPHGIGDQRIHVASVPLAALLDAMRAKL